MVVAALRQRRRKGRDGGPPARQTRTQVPLAQGAAGHTATRRRRSGAAAGVRRPAIAAGRAEARLQTDPSAASHFQISFPVRARGSGPGIDSDARIRRREDSETLTADSDAIRGFRTPRRREPAYQPGLGPTSSGLRVRPPSQISESGFRVRFLS